MAKENIENAIGGNSSHTRTNTHTHTHTHTHTATINNELETLARHDISHSDNGDRDGDGDHNCNNDDIHTNPDTPQKATADTSKYEHEEECVAKKRSVTFNDSSFEEIIEIPSLMEFNGPNDTTSIKDDLFYSDADYTRFRANEQRRYNKMVTKRLQQMVQEKMQPKINEAVASGATLEDIEAMVPKTQAEMVEYLGGQENINAAIQASSFGGQLSQKAIDSNHKRGVSKKNEKSENTADTEIESTRIRLAKDSNHIRNTDMTHGETENTLDTTNDSPRSASRKQNIRLAKDSNHIRNIDMKNGEIENTLDTTNESPRATSRKRTIRSSRSSIAMPRTKHDIESGGLDKTSNHSNAGGEMTMSVLEKAVAARGVSVERKRSRSDCNILEANINTNDANHTNNNETTMSVFQAVEAAREASLELIARDEEEDMKEFQ